jgi:hypothetical protein
MAGTQEFVIQGERTKVPFQYLRLEMPVTDESKKAAVAEFMTHVAEIPDTVVIVPVETPAGEING